MTKSTSKILFPLPSILHDSVTYDALRVKESDALTDLWITGHPGGVRCTAQAGVAEAFNSMSGKIITTGPTRAGMGVGVILPQAVEWRKKKNGN